MKIFDHKQHKVSRKYLKSASAYRRMLGGFIEGFDLSLDALVDQYRAETFGEPLKIVNNGYAFGKKNFDITLAAMAEDHAKGLFSKYELMHGSSWLARSKIKLFFPISLDPVLLS